MDGRELLEQMRIKAPRTIGEHIFNAKIDDALAEQRYRLARLIARTILAVIAVGALVVIALK